MNMLKTGFSVFCVVALIVMASIAEAGVGVGSSTLIQVLDYSDTFTTTDYGGLPDRDGIGGYPLSLIDYPQTGTPGEGLAVEDCYGNPQRNWSDGKWSIVTDATAFNGSVSLYPGNSGAGSDTGITQTGDPWAGWTIEYGMRDRFVVQFDAVQVPSTGWVSIVFGGTPDTFWAEDVTAILFRMAGELSYSEIGLFTVYNEVFEIDTGLDSPVYYANQWHNYAALVDITERTAELFVDEVSLGIVDFDTVGGGIYADVPLSSDFVGLVYNGDGSGDRMWTDNFQVGSPDDTPPPQIPGDANHDNQVNAADARLLATYWGTTGASWEMGDFNGDTVVNAVDASILAANWTVATEATGVPEPGVLTLVAGALAAAALARRK